MPAVPNLPGVPILSSYSVAGAVGALASDVSALLNLRGLFLPQWGIFQGGVAVVLADNVVTMDYKQEWNVSDFPLERGAFASYDKVASPFEARLRFSRGGNEAQRAALLASIAAIAGTLELFDIYTPEATYSNVNIVHYDYRRTPERGGPGLVIVDVTVREIRESGQSNFQNTAAPSGASQVGTGPVTATTPTSAQQTQIDETPPWG